MYQNIHSHRAISISIEILLTPGQLFSPTMIQCQTFVSLNSSFQGIELYPGDLQGGMFSMV